MITTTVSGRNFGLVLKGVEQLPATVDAAAAAGLKKGLEFAVGVVQREFLSGPRPTKLDVRTVRLRNSITKSVEVRPGRGVVGWVGTNVLYGAFHEFGFSGIQKVRAHTRVTSQTDGDGGALDQRRKFFGKAGEFIGYRESRKRAAGRQTSGFVEFGKVKAHDRRLDYKGRPFVHPGVTKALPVILKEVSDAIRGGLNA